MGGDRLKGDKMEPLEGGSAIDRVGDHAEEEMRVVVIVEEMAAVMVVMAIATAAAATVEGWERKGSRERRTS